MSSLQIVNELFLLLKKNKYKLSDGNFIFINKILNFNSKIAECGFFNNIINEIMFVKEIGKKLEENNNKKCVRKSIPKIVKTQVWNTYIGKENGISKCMCCKKSEISQLNFHCGHVISVYNGGSNIVENLRPICSQCNLSMGTQNMNIFMKEYGFANY
jgi:hypothetical protein